MPDSSTKCPHCGARPRSASRHCEFCGGLMPAAAVEGASAVAESSERRFERLELHASFPELLKKRPSAKGPIAAGIFGTIFAGVFLVIAFFALSIFGVVSWGVMQVTPFGFLFALIPIVIVGVGIYVFVRASLKTGRLATAEMAVQSAIVVGERTQVEGGGDGPGHTRYFVTLESRDGTRTELAASGVITGRVTPGDIGVAYIKADHLIDFERVRV